MTRTRAGGVGGAAAGKLSITSSVSLYGAKEDARGLYWGVMGPRRMPRRNRTGQQVARPEVMRRGHRSRGSGAVGAGSRDGDAGGLWAGKHGPFW